MTRAGKGITQAIKNGIVNKRKRKNFDVQVLEKKIYRELGEEQSILRKRKKIADKKVPLVPFFDEVD